MTLSIINIVIGMPDHLERGLPDQEPQVFLSSASLGKHIPRLVGKLADSKNIIRQQAIRALMGIYLIMRTQSSQASNQRPIQSPLQSVKGHKSVQGITSTSS
mmetsp:Transcript_8681/g.10206  ORF Transcript_8681/g.10206 Transcript_8681/m.10206 type:complete len:102 (+) Transcript_8681:122-427(+)